MSQKTISILSLYCENMLYNLLNLFHHTNIFPNIVYPALGTKILGTKIQYQIMPVLPFK